ncbi:MAG: translation elongation factor Ts [Patescibacteria group bacterium]
MSPLDLIKKLREISGAGVVDVKEALVEAGNDESKALDILRKKGQKIASKRQERATQQGVIESYVHANGKIAALVAVACETDFVARNSDFKQFAHEVALQIAATAPQYVSPSDVPADVVAKEKEIYREQLKNEGKPAQIVEKILEGKLQKFYSEVCLLKQPYIKDDSKTIEQLLTELIAKIGENIRIEKFIYFTL